MSDELDRFFEDFDISYGASPSPEIDVVKTKKTPSPTKYDSDVEDILTDPELNLTSPPPNQTQSSRTDSLAGREKQKCGKLHIGKRGLGTCNNLRCYKCDCAVVVFDDFCWKENVEYIFLRNNYPDLDRLSSQLQLKPGSRAYLCQCRCLDTHAERQALDTNKYSWFCAKH